jgi:hypothetical protein
VPRGYDEHWRIDSAQASGFVPVTAREPLDWQHVPDGFAPAFEALLPLQPAGQRRRTLLYGLAGTRDGVPELLICRAKNAAEPWAGLRPGQWSPYLAESSPRGVYTLRFKLLELEPRGGLLRLYRSDGHRTGGFTVPERIADELIAGAGPVAEWTGTFDFMNGLVDLDTQLEIYDRHTAWLESVIRHLAENEPWDGFFVHWHVVEYAHHIAGAALDDAHPRHSVAQRRYLDFLRDTYQLLDRLVGTAAAAADGADGFALVSDHGHDVVHTLFYLNDFLRQRGWLVTREHGDHQEIDWSRSAAYGLFPGLILINSVDLWPGGIVKRHRVPALREEIAAALRGLVDPRTGRPVITAVLGPREMAAAGQTGPSAPDLFFTMDRGYEPATRLHAEHAPLFALTEPGQELTSGHGSFHPLSPSARTLALLRHPEIPADSRLPYPVHMVDLAPTFAQLRNARPPKPCDGRPLDLSQLRP